MNENKRMLIFFVSIVLIIATILTISFWPESDKKFACGVNGDKKYSNLGSTNYEQYKCLIKQDDKFAITISDGLSDEEKKSLNKAALKSNQVIYYISDEVSNTDLKKIKKNLKKENNSYDKTSLVLVDNKKAMEIMNKELKESNKIYDFLEKTGFVKFTCNTKSDSKYKNLSKLTYDQYNCLYNSEKPFVMVLTQSTCGYCEQYLPVINEYAGNNNIPVYFLEIDTMDSQDANKIFSSLSYFEENQDWGTPLTLAIKDKKVITEISGYTDDTSAIEALFKKIELK